MLNRDQIEKEMCEILRNFEKNHTNINFKKGFYIYGSSGVGKTTFVLNEQRRQRRSDCPYQADSPEKDKKTET